MRLALVALLVSVRASAQTNYLNWVSRVPTTMTCSANDPLGTACQATAAPFLISAAPSTVFSLPDLSTKVVQNASTTFSTQTIHISGVRNETVPFQVFIQAPAAGLVGLNVEMSILTGVRTGTTISTQTASGPGWARLYVSSGIVVSTGSVNIATGAGYMSPPVDAQHPNIIPDILIPRFDPYYNQRTNAWPVGVSANIIQSFVGEVTIPTGIQSDIYTFTVTFSTNGSTIGTLAGGLEVWDATMSAKTTAFPIWANSEFSAMNFQQYGASFSGGGKYNPTCASGDTNGQNLEMHDKMVYCLDHRMNCGDFTSGNTTFAQYQTMMGHLQTGTASGDCRINTIVPGAAVSSVRMGLQLANNSTAASWENGFTSNYSSTTIMPFNQPCDEPGSAGSGNWPSCFTSMNGIAASGLANAITVNYTNALAAGATGQINAFVTQTHGDAATNKANTLAWIAVAPSTRSWGQYSACDSGPCSGAGGTGYSNLHVDGLAINHIMQPFVVLADTGTFTYLFDIDYCEISGSNCGANGVANPFIVGGVLKGQTSHGSTSTQGQGDGTLFYYGTTPQVGVSTPIVMGSFRSDALMEAQVSAGEYKNLLALGGDTTTWWTNLNRWYTNEQTINEDPYLAKGSYTGSYYDSRQRNGCAIHVLAHPGATCAW